MVTADACKVIVYLTNHYLKTDQSFADHGVTYVECPENIDLQIQFLTDFPCQCLCRRFTRINFPAREFPKSCGAFMRGSARK